jgi:hypothetical protein
LSENESFVTVDCGMGIPKSSLCLDRVSISQI